MFPDVVDFFFAFFLDSYDRDLSKNGHHLFVGPKLDFIWIFEISPDLKTHDPVTLTEQRLSSRRLIGLVNYVRCYEGRCAQ